MGFVYQFGNKEYQSMAELGKDLTTSWELTKNRLFDNELITAISVMDPVLGNKIEVCRQIKNLDRAVFVLQYLLNNTLGFSYKGLVYEDLSKVGRSILDQSPYINEQLEDALRLGLFSDFMRLKEIDVNYPKHYKEIVDLEKSYENAPLESYFKLGFLLSEDKGFRFDNRTFSDQNAFFNYLIAYNKVEEFAKVKWNLYFLSAWLDIQNLEEEGKKWKERLAVLDAWK